jgi:predicted aspartyl protease
MTHRFNLQDSLVVVLVELQGPAGRRSVRLALDTGASFTVIRTNILRAVGYDVEASLGAQQIATANGVIAVPVQTVQALTALDHTHREMAVLSH